MPNEFAVVIPIGPGIDEIARLTRLLKSILKHEPAVGWIILIDDDIADRKLDTFVTLPQTCKVITLKNPRGNTGIGSRGGLFVGVMRGLQWVAEHTRAVFTLKIDTDSLIIRPFSDTICQALADGHEIGQVGVIGRTCNREDSTFGCENGIVSELIEMHKLWNEILTSCHYDVVAVRNMAKIVAGLRWCTRFDQIEPILARAIQNDYRTLKYCQGGAYALSAELLDRLLKQRCFEHCLVWAHAQVGEDVILSMYVYSVGLRLLDLSDRNQLFGLHWRGLPFRPETMIDRGYSIIHSLKNNSPYAEEELAAFFEKAAPQTSRKFGF